ncbi:MAG: hypothetical protein H6668_02770 [Ardenticatenaceae bacterium]|nr:hypothetical protein [Ardenticatenaceae bacterium]
MSEQMDKVVKETYRYFYVDGLVETAVGLLFAFIGLVLAGWAEFEQGSWLLKTAVIILPILIIGGTFGIKWLVGSLKERITYPRTGYVAYRPGEPNNKRWLLPLFAALLVLLMFLFPAWLNKMAFVQGALLAFILGIIGYRVALARFYLSAGIAFAIGLLATLFVANEVMGSAITFGGTGVLMLLMGLIVFTTYLRQHPIPEIS